MNYLALAAALLVSRLSPTTRTALLLSPEGPPCYQLTDEQLERQPWFRRFSRKERDQALSAITAWEEQGIQMAARGDQDYPPGLLHMERCPEIFYWRGTSGLWTDLQRSVAIVGSRNASVEMCTCARLLGTKLAEAGGVVVSGLALGIDAAAHSGALEFPSSTIAVLGNGVDQFLPNRNRSLGEKILASGGVVCSQFEPGTPAFPKNFLIRNGVIAALSNSVIVVAAAERSGSLNTVRWALELGREVYALPGGVFDPTMRGCNLLLRDGAKIIVDVADVAELLPLEFRAQQPVNHTESGEVESTAVESFLKLLEREGAQHVNDLALLFPSLSDTELLLLEVQGTIRRQPGGYISR